MSTYKDLQILSNAAFYDKCNTRNYNRDNILRKNTDDCIYNAKMGNREIPLFKILLTNKCKNDCAYCINCNKHKNQKVELTPEELAHCYMKYYEDNTAEGLFLSSGIKKDADQTMHELIETAHILRNKYSYQGYIHLKVIPGATRDDIKHAMQLADRVSINIESATSEGLSDLATTKDYNKDIIKRISWISRLSNRYHELAPSGFTTQLIVGANDETDKQIIDQTHLLRKKYKITNNYFSSFIPVKDTPLENKQISDPMRTNRLYQVEYLFSQYHIKKDELIFNDDGFLNLNEDPKYNIAVNNMDKYPIDVNTASYNELIHIPGIGVKTARRIKTLKRKNKKITSLKQLKNMGANVNRCKTFIKIKGQYQSTLF
ncbi:helix-hairpin-helix domain-containing protein [uncultured Methanosphaera sp.]|uniref:helix-hairpin-helix domain-containing protein n=1 Tax=uncultured Methanosphaera sp. TaxID=262501 RepID=UPI002803CDEB|nr:helix-hairpin-helix domain-containing protein [uncultured Methanosphaera sp.]